MTMTTRDEVVNDTLDTLALLTFRLDDQQYGLPISDVVEVAAMVEIMRIAGQPPEILGMVNRRGTPLTLVDLRKVFGRGGETIDISTLFIVAAPADQPTQQLGLVVDEVQQVEYTGNIITAMPSPDGAQFIRGIVNHRSRLIQIVAVAPLVRAYVPSLGTTGA